MHAQIAVDARASQAHEYAQVCRRPARLARVTFRAVFVAWLLQLIGQALLQLELFSRR
jgi:hypothetical protein